jgi:integrase
MPLNIYRREATGIYYIRGKVQGIAYDRSAQTRSRSEAEAIKAKIEKALFDRAIYGAKAVATFDEAVAQYIEAGGSPDHLDALLDRIGHRLLSDVDQNLIDRLAKDMKPDAAPSTRIRQIYTPILAVMNHAATVKLCDPIRIKKPKLKAGRTEYLTPQQADDWLDALPDHLRRLVTFYLSTGCRASEALSLEWKDISLGGQRAVFWDTKGGYARHADLQRRARDMLPERSDRRFKLEGGDEINPVWLNSRGEPWHSYDAINLMLKRHRLKHPHLAPAHCHLFRHTWATWAYAVTHDMSFLMQQGGWRSATMVMRYAHAGSADLAAAVLKAGWEFDGRRAGPTRKKRIES